MKYQRELWSKTGTRPPPRWTGRGVWRGWREGGREEERRGHPPPDFSSSWQHQRPGLPNCQRPSLGVCLSSRASEVLSQPPGAKEQGGKRAAGKPGWFFLPLVEAAGAFALLCRGVAPLHARKAATSFVVDSAIGGCFCCPDALRLKYTQTNHNWRVHSCG